MCQLRVSYEVRQLRHLETNVRRETCGYVYTVASGRALSSLNKVRGYYLLSRKFLQSVPIRECICKKFFPLVPLKGVHL